MGVTGPGGYLGERITASGGRVALSPVLLIDAVGLTPRHLGDATPALSALAVRGESAPLGGVLPAVTCSAQATMLTGTPPGTHGIVGNGWLYRETGEVRFWQQSRELIEASPVYDTARRRAAEKGEPFTCAKMFWWFVRGAGVDWSVTPGPHYGADGGKVLDIESTPPDLARDLERDLGSFPFPAFWGPMAGRPSTDWIARATARVLREKQPTLTLVYLPHLDYDLQRHGPDLPELPERLRELDAAVGVLLEAAEELGALPIVVSEYGLVPVARPVFPNRHLRERGFLEVRHGPFGERLDPHRSGAFAVADHQVAHVYVRDLARIEEVAARLAELDGVGEILDGRGKPAAGLDHERSGELVLLAERDAWFAYPYWTNDARAPDFARTVDIHRKPGYDPAELLLDPACRFPKFRAARFLLRKKLGFRALLDVVPLDPGGIRGSHGLAPDDPRDGPIVICGEAGRIGEHPEMVGIKDLVLAALGLEAAAGR
jgi:predicted AlkP superfamily pyrophosphatase or phosphodiesterase